MMKRVKDLSLTAKIQTIDETQCIFDGQSHLERLVISESFSVIHSSNRNKFRLPEELVILYLDEGVPLPIESVDFSAVKKVMFDFDMERLISNDYIRYVLRSSKNL